MTTPRRKGSHEHQGNKDGPRWTDAYSKARLLVGRMTVEEKANVTRGFASRDNVCAGNSGSVPRLGWPGMCLHDAANGVHATDMVSAYPAGLHVGAAWDRAAAYRQAVFMAGEFKAKGGERLSFTLGPIISSSETLNSALAQSTLFSAPTPAPSAERPSAAETGRASPSTPIFRAS